jgi:hypothetical protein
MGVMLAHAVLGGGDLDEHLNRCMVELRDARARHTASNSTQPGDSGRSPLAVVWSGTLARSDPGGFGADPRTWLPSGRRAFAERFEATAARLRAQGLRPALRPHARHAIGDHHAARHFAADPARAADGAAVLLDLGALLTRSMLPALEDHAQRVLDSAAAYPPGRLAGVVLSGVDTGVDAEQAPPGEGSADVDDGPALALVPLSAARGVDPGPVARLAACCWTGGLEGVPLVLLDDGHPGRVEEDLGLLRRAGLPL